MSSDRRSIDSVLSQMTWGQPRVRRIVIALAAVIFVLMAAFAGFAGHQWREATRQRAVAEEQRDEIATRNIATLANQALDHGDAGTSMLLAMEALPDRHAGVNQGSSSQAEAALFAGTARLQEVALGTYGQAVRPGI